MAKDNNSFLTEIQQHCINNQYNCNASFNNINSISSTLFILNYIGNSSPRMKRNSNNSPAMISIW